MPSPNEWDRRYGEQEWSSDPDPFLVELSATLPPGRAIDLGCGTGRNAIYLAQHGWEVTGVDTSAVGLAILEEGARRAGVALRTSHRDLFDVEEDDESFDLVVLANIHPKPADRPAMFAQATRLLRRGGHLFFVGHHLEALGSAGPPDPDLLYTTEALLKALPAEIEPTRLETYRREPDDPGHRGDVGILLWATKMQ